MISHKRVSIAASHPGIKVGAIFVPALKFRLYGLYLNHMNGVLFAAGSYAFARFCVRRQLKVN